MILFDYGAGCSQQWGSPRLYRGGETRRLRGTRRPPPVPGLRGGSALPRSSLTLTKRKMRGGARLPPLLASLSRLVAPDGRSIA